MRLARYSPLFAAICFFSTVSIAPADAVFSPAAADTGLQQELNRIFNAPEWKSTWWGVKVVDLQTSNVLYELNADKAFMPASNMKLVSTAAALAALGPDFRYETRLYASGPMTSDGHLKGDLVIVGSGDPSISNRYSDDRFDDVSRETKASGAREPENAIRPILENWTKAIKGAGIRRIEGAVIADDDVFDDRPRAGSWQIDYYPEWYAAESSGLAMKDNAWDVVIHPGDKVGDPARLEVPLGTKYVTFRNQIVTTGPASSDARTTDGANGFWPDPEIVIERGLDNNEVTLSGTIVHGRPPFREWGAVHNGTLYGATLLAEELERQGITVDEGPKDIDDLPNKSARVNKQSLKLITTHKSPPLAEIARIINKPSQNFYADMVQRSLAPLLAGQPGSFAAGENAVRDVLTSAGVSSAALSELRMADGSGLSRQNRVTPSLMIEILAAMRRQPEPTREAFERSLPVMGIDGTLRTRLRHTPAEGAVHAKTGTIGSVRALSGYLNSADNRPLAFSMIANHYNVPTSHATQAQDQALLVLLKHSVGNTSSSATPTTADEAGNGN